MPEEYPSRLGHKAPVRGLGAAYSKNQALAGVQDPDSASRLAAMDPQEATKILENVQKSNEILEDQRAEILAAWEAKEYQPADPKAPKTADANWLSAQPPPVVKKLHEELISSREKAVDEETEKEAKTFRDSFAINPDDPLYDPMTDKERRKKVEKDLKPLDFESMVFYGFSDQEVEPRAGFKLVFRTLSTQHGLWIESQLSDIESQSVQYGRHWFSLLQVAASLQTINGKQVGLDLSKYDSPEHRDDFKKALDARMKFLGRLPAELTNDLIVQFVWFCGRVRKSLAGNLTEKVGN